MDYCIPSSKAHSDISARYLANNIATFSLASLHFTDGWVNQGTPQYQKNHENLPNASALVKLARFLICRKT